MTQHSRDGSQRSEFGRWLRENPCLDSKLAGLSVVDIDWCIHQYKEWTQHGSTREYQNIMFIEEKTHEADILANSAQRDTLSAVNQILLSGCREGQPARFKVKSRITGQQVNMRCFGYHLLRFSHSGPYDSMWIEWDWKRIDVIQLEKLLRFELSPLTMRPRTERSHHGGKPQKRFGF